MSFHVFSIHKSSDCSVSLVWTYCAGRTDRGVLGAVGTQSKVSDRGVPIGDKTSDCGLSSKRR